MRPQAASTLTLVFGLMLSAFASSCAPPVRDTQISVGGGSVPEFTLRGGAALTSFKVFGTAPNDVANKPTTLLWEIEPLGATKGPTLDEVQLIRFGTLPTGFTQRFPQSGTPDIFAENVTYVGVVGIAGRPEVTMQVQVRNGKTVFVGPVTQHRNIPTH